MLKHALVTVTTTALLLAMLTACADEDQSNSSASNAADTAATKPAQSTPKPSKRAERAESKKVEAQSQSLEGFQSAAIMGQPVDFATAESAASSLQAIKQEAGDEAASRVESAINYMLVYDLSVSRNKQKLYKKLNGKTPNEILAMASR